MPPGIDRLTSLLVRELAIASKNYGHLARTCWEMSRLLLKSNGEYATVSGHKEEVGSEAVCQPSLEFGSGSEEDYD